MMARAIARRGRAKERISFMLERFGDTGWIFATCNEIPGIMLFGPTEENVEAQMIGAVKLLVGATAEEVSNT